MVGEKLLTLCQVYKDEVLLNLRKIQQIPGTNPRYPKIQI